MSGVVTFIFAHQVIRLLAALLLLANLALTEDTRKAQNQTIEQVTKSSTINLARLKNTTRVIFHIFAATITCPV